MGDLDTSRGGNYPKDPRGGPTLPSVVFSPTARSKDYPNFSCRNGCGFSTPEDSGIIKCPNCGLKLSRWVSRYEEKG